MDGATMIAPATTGVSTATVTQSQGVQAEDAVSFAQFLNGMTTSGTTTTGQQATNADGGLSWREMQMLMSQVNTTGLQTGTDGEATFEGLYEAIMGMLSEMTEKPADEVTDDEKAQLLDLVEQLKQQLSMMGLGTEMDQNQPLMLFLAQVGEQTPVPVYEEDGTITLKLPAGEALLEQLLNSEPEELLSMLTGIPQENLQALLGGKATGTETQNTTLPQGGAPQDDLADIPLAELVGSGAADTETAEGDAEFQSNVRTAKEQLAGTQAAANETTSKTTVDLNELQKQVDQGVYLQNTAYAQNVQQADESLETTTPRLLTQVQDGILSGLQKGEEQFRIMLKPEGLGELEVRLTKTAEGLMLNLITKNSETQRMLAAEMSVLRDNLRPYQIEVGSVLTEQQDNFLSQQQGFEQQAWRSRQEMFGTTGRGRDATRTGDEQQLEALQAAQTQVRSTLLDAYV